MPVDKIVIFTYSGATSNPAPLLAIQCTLDTNHNGDLVAGLTPMPGQYRIYQDPQVITITAPLTNPNGGTFVKWLINGTTDTSRTTNVTLNVNKSITAVYSQTSGALTGYIQSTAALNKVTQGYVSGLNSISISNTSASTTAVTATPTAGSGSYTYLWNTAVTTAGTTIAEDVVKWVTITDSNTFETVTLYVGSTYRSDVTIDAAAVQPDCASAIATGTLSVVANHSSEPDTYLWSVTGATTQDDSFVFPSGNFSRNVRVQDINGMNVLVTLNATGKAILAVTATGTDNTDLFTPTGTVSAVVTGGTGAYTYLWNNGATTANVTNLYAGNYTVIVTDSLGCQKQESVTISQPFTTVTGLTYEQTQNFADRMACCAGELAQKIVNEKQSGVKLCGCEESDWEYIVRTYPIVKAFIPVGTAVNSANVSKAVFDFAPDEEVHNITVKVNGTAFYTHVGIFATIKLMVESIIATITTYTADTTNVSSNINIYPPSVFAAGDIIEIAFQSEVPKINRAYTVTMPQNGYIQTSAMNCLTEAQVRKIMANVTSICGCCE